MDKPDSLGSVSAPLLQKTISGESVVLLPVTHQCPFLPGCRQNQLGLTPVDGSFCLNSKGIKFFHGLEKKKVFPSNYLYK